jgi:hypothetical protein
MAAWHLGQLIRVPALLSEIFRRALQVGQAMTIGIVSPHRTKPGFFKKTGFLAAIVMHPAHHCKARDP